ncbi:MAG: recombination mediator RecR [Phycisphaerales bacterium]
MAHRSQPSQTPGPEGAAYPQSVTRLLERLGTLPGIGRRSAERLAFHLLKASKADAMELARAIADVKQQVRHCEVCFNFADGERCAVCDDTRRDRSTVLVVEQPKDLIALEQAGMYRGLYHVLLGRLAPLDGVTPGDLTIDRLAQRLRDPSTNPGAAVVGELILGLSPTLEGDGTALYLTEEFQRDDVKITRLARGLPAGREIEQTNKAVLADALEGRREV